MPTIFDYFTQITQIPHCSHNADKLKGFLIEFATSKGYDVQTDAAQNLLIKKGTPALALQAHYDMVCVGKAPVIETYIEDGWMAAHESTLGADNGMAIAMMMKLIEKGKACEFIITSDEEVGLIGANALSFDLDAKYLLNLDSEDEGEVYIGCAGGVDIEAYKTYEMQLHEGTFYEIEISGLPGGHSGVEIHKNIPNAIKVLGEFLIGKNAKIVSIKGGERVNSIPVHVTAIVHSDEPLESSDNIIVNAIKGAFSCTMDDEIISLIKGFENGVLAFNEQLGVPDTSINLALISFENGNLKIETSARAMDDSALGQTQKKYEAYFTGFSCEVKSIGKYPAWKPDINDFSKIVEKAMVEVFGKSTFKAIHAGLETAIISQKYPQLKLTSIGPNIRSPHSTHEKVEIASVEKIFKVVEKIVDKYAS